MGGERKQSSEGRAVWTGSPFLFQLAVFTFELQNDRCNDYATHVDPHEHVMEEYLQEKYPINGSDFRLAGHF